MGQVVPLRPELSFGEDSTATLDTQAEASSIAYRSSIDSGRGNIDTESIYPASNEVRPELSVAFSLINEALEHASAALDFIDDDNPLSSDDSIMKFHAVLPELFCCRSIGDGFANIVLSLFHSIANMNTTGLNRSQIVLVRKCANRLKSEPFLSFEDSLSLAMEMEDVGLNLEPEYFEGISGLLDE